MKVICCLILCLLSCAAVAQKHLSILSGDIFQTAYFIENHGQFDAYKDRGLPVKYGVENAGTNFYFNAGGFMYHVTRIVPKEADKKKTKEHDADKDEDDDEENKKTVEGNITMRWLNANPNPQIECINKSAHYFSYGDAPYMSYGYKKIIYHNLYPGIDVVYTIPARGGVEYSLIVKPGADLTKVQFKYIGNNLNTLLTNNGLTIQSSIDTLSERNLKATYNHTAPAICHYILNKGIIGFAANISAHDTLIIDPWVTPITTFTNQAATRNKGYNVDYDRAGNLYVYGNGGGSNGKTVNTELAKYSTAGNLLWTFTGKITSIGWNSGNWGAIGNFVVDKSKSMIYMGQGYAFNGTIIVRLDSSGAYNKFATTANGNFSEVWNMKFNCSTGDVLGMGGCVPTNLEIGDINTTTAAFAPVNFTGIATGEQDIVSAAFDNAGGLYVILASRNTPSVSNNIFSVTQALTGYNWQVPCGYKYFTESFNKPYAISGTSNGFNALAANGKYLFYYDGFHIKAYNLTTGAAVGSPDSIPGYVGVMQGGIYADDCNNIYVGGTNGNIKVFTFDSTGFIAQPDIVIPGMTNRHIYDIRYYGGTNALYVCGDSMVATITPSINCVSVIDALNINVAVGCTGTITTITNADTSAMYTYVWTDSTTNKVVRQLTSRYHYADTLKAQYNNDVYQVSVIKNINCEALSAHLDFISPFPVATRNHNICMGQSYVYNSHTYTKAGTYVDTVANKTGCDSIVTLKIAVIDTSTHSITTSICMGQSYTVGTQSYTKAGKYTTILTNAAGCDSAVTLTLTIKDTSATAVSAAICAKQSYSFNGHNYNSTGTYKATLTNKAGCDSVVTLNLTVNTASAKTINTAICAGQSYTLNSTSYTKAGTYIDSTLKNKVGCDSVITINLTVNTKTTHTIDTSICMGKTYTLHGTGYTKAGIYIDSTLKNKAGCDSIITINLTVIDTSTHSITTSICAGHTYTVGTHTYAATGTYTVTLTNKGGCDSVVTLNLTVNDTSATAVTADICAKQSYSFNGHNYNSTGIYKAILTNKTGCDSIVTLHLTVNNPSAYAINAAICAGQSYPLNGINYTKTGTYIDSTLKNTVGCDSFITLHLTVNNPSAYTINTAICAGQSYTLNGTNYTRAGTYIDSTLKNSVGCDSFITLNITVNALPVITATVTNPYVCTGDTCTLEVSGAANYVWQPGNYTGTSITIQPGTTATYTITGTDNNGCHSTDSIAVDVHKKLYNGTQADTSVNDGAHITLWTSNPASVFYNWAPVINLSSVSISNPIATATNAITYYVVYIDKQGCRETDTINIAINPCDVFVPNAFTPNSDGVNDYIYPIGIGGVAVDAFTIYNRWGSIMYTYNPSRGWDGMFKGQPCTIDAYVYILKYHCADGHVHMKNGNITLLR